jgi:hypothetical protein
VWDGQRRDKHEPFCGSHLPELRAVAPGCAYGQIPSLGSLHSQSMHLGFFIGYRRGSHLKAGIRPLRTRLVGRVANY